MTEIMEFQPIWATFYSLGWFVFVTVYAFLYNEPKYIKYWSVASLLIYIAIIVNDMFGVTFNHGSNTLMRLVNFTMTMVIIFKLLHNQQGGKKI